MRRFNFLMNYRPFMDAPGEGGGAGAGAGGGGEPPAPYVPEGMTENWRGEDDKSTIDTLFGIAKGYRDADAQRGSPPASADEYTFEPGDTLSPYIHDTSDPVLTAAKGAAHELGLTNDQYQGMIEKTLAPLVEQGLIEAPYDPQSELTSLGKALSLDSDGIAKAVTNATTFAEGLVGQFEGVPDEYKDAVKDRLAELADDHIGVMTLQYMQARMGKAGIKVDGQSVHQSGMTKEDLDRLDRDERVDPNSPKFDPELRRKYDEAYRSLHG